ncbi:uncharacterized protein VICG_00090 [Vittaforma corneae ATCC 50505]|uniref:Uncharacterized protein n=1 Tax=Vittaforma corneae (strain ATCC 50505) TaxID=993615 RepID=L2GQI2_VITCO|nr:uncharacterized protein VICG_00090 [Vittaforma corneae ATCC 50505]ELA42775.1 hypothetical protein VICG_00090 [Vittaforma corneae ATCC 50505]
MPKTIVSSNIESKETSCMSFKEDLKTLRPKIDHLKTEIKSQMVPFAVHQVMIGSLSNELEEIKNTVGYLESKLDFEKKVYERTKQILLSLTVDQDNLHILETGSFTDDDDLIKIEKSLSILKEFSRGKCELKIVKEREREILDLLSNFLKRFVMFLSKLFIKSESKNELRVHRSFYEKMMKYKFIYTFSKTNSEYYTVLCVAYTRKSKDLYNEEFENHLNRVSELITDVNSLKFTLDALVMTYESLLECETNFLSLMDISSDIREIFSGVDLMIVDFIDIFFKMSPFCIIIALNLYTTGEFVNRLGSLGQSLKEKKAILEEVFLHQQKSTGLSFEVAGLINELNKMPIKSDFLENLVHAVIKKARKQNVQLEEGLKNHQIIHSVERLDDKKEIIECMERYLTPKIIDRIFGGRNERSEIKEIFKAVDSQKGGYVEAISFIKKTILENCEEAKRNEYIKILAEVNKT